MKSKKTFKIGILIDQLIIGGVQKIALEDARVFTKLGHKAEVLVLMRKGYKKEYKNFTNGVKIRFLSDNYPWPLKYSIKFPIFSFFSTLHILSPFLAHLAIEKKEFDIIISHGTTTCFTAQGLKKTRSIPYLALIHDPMNYILKVAYRNSSLRFLIPLLNPLLKYLEKNLIQDSEAVLLLSKLHQEFISKTYKTKTVILPAAARASTNHPNNNRSFILASTRWETNKNPGLLLQIAHQIPDSKIKIAGSWSSENEFIKFKNEIEKQQLSSQIELHPNLPENKLVKLYQGARVFIHPIREAFSMGGLEASANACPVIIPRGSGITNYLTNHSDGIFLKNTEASSFTAATKKLWNNPNLAQKMGLSARKKVLALSWENHAQKLLEIISDSLTGKGIHLVALETGHASESYLSGGDKLLEKMAGFLSKDIKITVICPKIGKKHWQKAKLTNITLLTLPETFFDNKPNPSLIFIAYLLRIWHSYFIIRKIKNIDLIYSSTNVFPDVVPAFLYTLSHQKPWISRVHHLVQPPFKRPGRLSVNIVSYTTQIMANFMLRSKSTKTFALNTSLVNILSKKGFPAKKISVLGGGIELEKIQKEKPFKNIRYDAVFVGRLHPTKGIYDLVKIWSQVVKTKSNAKAIIIGGGAKEEIRKLSHQIQKANLSKNLILSGYLTEKILLKTLKSSHIFLFTDHEAGWSLAIAEAMAAGLPVVGYQHEIFKDVYKKGFITSKLGDTNAFANDILKLIYDKKLYGKLKTDALFQAQKLSWAQTAKKFSQTIHTLV